MIVLDGGHITAELSGIGRYALGLIAGLASINPPQRIAILGGEEALIVPAISHAKSMEWIRAPGPALSLRSQWRTPRILRRLEAKVFHCPYVTAPIMPMRARLILTVHDLIPQRCTSGLARSKKVKYARVWRAWCRAQYRRAGAIITVSEFSRRELIEYERLDAEKVVRIHNGVDPASTGSAERFRAKFNVPPSTPIVSYLGRHDPYKNVLALVQAFEGVHQDHSTALLIIGGKLDDRYPEARDRAARSRAREAIIFTGYLSEADRADLLAASAVFAFPSRYEGFGLPPLEAMAAGVPVVASNAASLPEALGDAATLVEPDDVDGLSNAIINLLRSETLRTNHIEAGRRQAVKFTWRKCAEEHLAIYDRVMRE